MTAPGQPALPKHEHDPWCQPCVDRGRASVTAPGQTTRLAELLAALHIEWTKFVGDQIDAGNPVPIWSGWFAARLAAQGVVVRDQHKEMAIRLLEKVAAAAALSAAAERVEGLPLVEGWTNTTQWPATGADYAEVQTSHPSDLVYRAAVLSILRGEQK